MTRYAIYTTYGRYTDQDGPPERAPKRDVQVIAIEDATVGRRLLSAFDFYWWDQASASWLGGDVFGLYDYLALPGWALVLFGRHVPSEAYHAALNRAVTDSYLAPKSAWYDHERRP
jgi:hypothetical protein